MRVPMLLSRAFLAAVVSSFSWVAPIHAEDRPSAESQDNAASTPVRLTEEALKIHREALVFDGHNNLTWKLRTHAELLPAKVDLGLPQKNLHTDLPRMRQGGVGAQFWAVYQPPATGKNSNVRDVMAQIDHIHELAKSHPDDLELAYTADDVARIRRDGKIASLISVEGGHAIDNSLPVLRMYQQLGVRSLALTHMDSHDWADAAMDKSKHKGLNKFGEQVVLEMNRLGMIIDLSHASVDTMRHAILASQAPVIFSHSAAHKLAPHPRNVPDEVLGMLPRNGGVVLINFYPAFLTAKGVRAYEERSQAALELRSRYANERQYQLALKQWLKDRPLPPATVRDVVDHIDHIVKVAGIEHVGLGSNFDGMGSVPGQLEDVSCFPYITQELLTRGYTPAQIHKVLGGNLLRVLRQAEQTAHNAGTPAKRQRFSVAP